MVALEVNGQRHEIDVDPATPLLQVLRNELGLTGAKLGCGLEQCYACAVIAGDEVVTRVAWLLEREPAPSDERIREALEPHLCRCGTHPRVLAAARRAAEEARS